MYSSDSILAMQHSSNKFATVVCDDVLQHLRECGHRFSTFCLCYFVPIYFRCNSFWEFSRVGTIGRSLPGRLKKMKTDLKMID